ncbi:Obg family GTPase CgtA [Streptomyces sp. M10(2022)]
MIEEELRQYGGLENRPRIVALNKVDIPDGQDLADIIRPDLEARGYRVFEVSAIAHKGLNELSYALAGIIAEARASTPKEESTRVVIRPKAVDDAGFTVKQDEEGIYRVRGEKPERWIRQTDFNNDEAVGYLADRLNRLGVEDALRKAGAGAGDGVAIGPEENAVVFDWEPSMMAGAEMLGRRGEDHRLEAPRPAAQRRRDRDAEPDESQREYDEFKPSGACFESPACPATPGTHARRVVGIAPIHPVSGRPSALRSHAPDAAGPPSGRTALLETRPRRVRRVRRVCRVEWGLSGTHGARQPRSRVFRAPFGTGNRLVEGDCAGFSVRIG